MAKDSLFDDDEPAPEPTSQEVELERVTSRIGKAIVDFFAERLARAEVHHEFHAVEFTNRNGLKLDA